MGVGVYVAWWTTDALFGWMGKAKDKAEELRERIKEYDSQTEADLAGMMKSSSPAARIFLTLVGV